MCCMYTYPQQVLVIYIVDSSKSSSLHYVIFNWLSISLASGLSIIHLFFPVNEWYNWNYCRQEIENPSKAKSVLW
jgi:choline-glycine betaine transporter